MNWLRLTLKKLVYNEEQIIRLDVFLNNNLELSRNYIQVLIDSKDIKVNDKTIKKSYKLQKGDVISITLPEAKELDLIAENIPLDIIYECDDYLVVNKPKDMVVHPSAGHDSGTLVNALLYHCDSLSTINGVQRPGIVHRMDKDTTGLLVVTKNDTSHKYFSELFKTHDINRRYYALVHGVIKDELIIEKPLARDKKDRKKITVDSDGKKAITKVRVVENFLDYTLVECQLFTGRTHQIRVHLRSINHPIVGDKTYGVKKEKFNLDSQLLHARTIGFVDRLTGNYVEYNMEVPDVFEKVLNNLRRKDEKCRS